MHSPHICKLSSWELKAYIDRTVQHNWLFVDSFRVLAGNSGNLVSRGICNAGGNTIAYEIPLRAVYNDNEIYVSSHLNFVLYLNLSLDLEFAENFAVWSTGIDLFCEILGVSMSYHMRICLSTSSTMHLPLQMTSRLLISALLIKSHL